MEIDPEDPLAHCRWHADDEVGVIGPEGAVKHKVGLVHEAPAHRINGLKHSHAIIGKCCLSYLLLSKCRGSQASLLHFTCWKTQVGKRPTAWLTPGLQCSVILLTCFCGWKTVCQCCNIWNTPMACSMFQLSLERASLESQNLRIVWRLSLSLIPILPSRCICIIPAKSTDWRNPNPHKVLATLQASIMSSAEAVPSVSTMAGAARRLWPSSLTRPEAQSQWHMRLCST